MMSPSLCCGRSESNTFESPGPVVVPGQMSQDFQLQVLEINLIASFMQKGMSHSFPQHAPGSVYIVPSLKTRTALGVGSLKEISQ